MCAAWLAIGLGGGCAHWAEPDARVDQSEWRSPAGVKGVQLLTDHFDMRVTAKDEVLREFLPTFMEDAYQAYEKLIPTAGIDTQPSDAGSDDSLAGSPAPAVAVNGRSTSSERLLIYLFEDRDQWVAFTLSNFPANAETYLHILSGGYTDESSATAVAFDVHRDHTLSLLGHEGLHQYFARHLPERIPAWVNEGLATQFEAFELNDMHPNFTPRRNYARLVALSELVGKKDGLIPLPELLRMNAGEAIRGIRYGSRAYYAQVWSLIVFMSQGPCPVEYNQGYQRLLADLGTQRMHAAISAQRVTTENGDKISDGELLFRHYIAEDLKQAEAEYREFALALIY
jgi:hypothetical protein